jgi:hypothetical protein
MESRGVPFRTVPRIKDIVVDCRHPASLARFWAAVLDDYEVAPYDDDEIERLRAMGIDDLEDDPGVMIESRSGGHRLYFQQVPEPKVAKNRVHLDLAADDPQAALDLVLSLGGTEIRRHETFALMADPEGNELCITW